MPVSPGQVWSTRIEGLEPLLARWGTMTTRALPSIGRAKPAPKIPSTTSAAPSITVGSSGSIAPGQRAAACAASPRSAATAPSSATRTGQPRSASTRAATKPSPPLFPGPQRATSGRGDQRRETVSATLRPAFSIRLKPGMPRAIVSRSASAICVGVSKALRCQPSRENAIREMWGGGNPGVSPVLTSGLQIVTSTADGGCSSVG